MVASEAAPFAKTGGLADVLGALPQALQARGEEVAVVLPRYGRIRLDGARRVFNDLRIWLGPACWRADLHRIDDRGVPVYLVDCPALYDRETLYGPGGADYPDNHVRFAVLARAALAVVRRLFRPEIVHCHDWQASLVPVYMRHLLAGDPTFYGIRTLLTIHNLGYPGLFPPEILPEIGLDDSLFTPGVLEFWGQVSLLKGGIVTADRLNTVSRRYAREIQTEEFGFGMDGLLRARADVLTGILNGVDYAEWSPETDPHIAARYSAADLSGKLQCKRDLLAEFGLPADDLSRPVIGIVSRFTVQKGFDLISEVAREIAHEDVDLVALGTGDAAYEELFRDLAAAFPGRIAVRIAYDNRLAHKIEAGADMFLMPSRYEPCGLNQIYSLRYGAVPIVRATGGLDDTIDEGTGFKFREYTGSALMGAIRDALSMWRSPEVWRETMLRGMARDFSWNASAAEYAALYRRMLEDRP
ncbi:MAG: glycogen synthase GlgA [Acidobacteria bacterium]|nr:glycogen synthase GlgA [Acidobacteriota bacterium]